MDVKKISYFKSLLQNFPGAISVASDIYDFVSPFKTQCFFRDLYLQVNMAGSTGSAIDFEGRVLFSTANGDPLSFQELTNQNIGGFTQDSASLVLPIKFKGMLEFDRLILQPDEIYRFQFETSFAAQPAGADMSVTMILGVEEL